MKPNRPTALALSLLALVAASSGCSGRSLPSSDGLLADQRLTDAPDTPVQTEWVKAWGDGWAHLDDMAVDPAGNVVIVGHYTGSVTLGGHTLTAAMPNEDFIARIAPGGHVQWAMSIPCAVDGTSRAALVSVAMDASGVARVAGHFQGTCTFGSTFHEAYASTDLFVATVAADGSITALTRSDGEGTEESSAVAVGAGGTHLVGRYSGSARLGALTLEGGGLDNLVLAHIPAGGGFSWAARASGKGLLPQGIAVDPSGNAYIVGYFGEATFGATALSASASCGDFLPADPFVARASAKGTFAWAAALRGEACTKELRAVLADADRAYLVGSFQGKASLGAQAVAAAGDRDLLVAEVGADGAAAWLQPIGASGAEVRGVDLARHSSGDLIVLAQYTGSLDVAGPKLAVSDEALIVRMDPSGQVSWASSTRSTERTSVVAVGADASGYVYVGGEVRGETTFGATTLTPKGRAIFVWKLEPHD